MDNALALQSWQACCALHFEIERLFATMPTTGCKKIAFIPGARTKCKPAFISLLTTGCKHSFQPGQSGLVQTFSQSPPYGL